MSDGAERRLAVYGSLAPGRVNHHEVSMLRGTWAPGVVRGHLEESGWGSTLGFPGLVIDPEGPEVAVQVLTSDDLQAHWARLDAFEGAGYRRVVAPVDIAGATVPAMIYSVGGVED